MKIVSTLLASNQYDAICEYLTSEWGQTATDRFI